MSLIDTDKNSEDRGAPAPNTHDKIIDGAHKSHATISSHYTTDADTNTGRLQMGNKRILGNDGTTNRALLGYNSTTNTWGLFGSKGGQDVLTTTAANYAFSTDYNMFKIVSTVSLSVTVTLNAGHGTHNTASVAHGLGYTPAYIAFCDIPQAYYTDFGYTGVVNGPNPNLFWIDSVNGQALAAFCQASVDGTNVTLSAGVGSLGAGSYTFTAKVYLMAETST